MTVPATDNRPSLSDDDVLNVIAALAQEAGGGLPARDRVKDRTGVGSSRADRLLGVYAEREGITPPARRNGHLRPVPNRAAEASAARANGRADAGDATQLIPRPDTSRPAGGPGDQGNQASPAQADRAGGPESPAEQTAVIPPVAQADRAVETGRTGDTAQADNRAADRADQATADTSPDADRAAESGGAGPSEAKEWSKMLRGAVGGWLAADRSARDDRPAEPQSRPARIWRAVVTWAPGVVAFIAAFLATWAGGVTLATRLGWGPVEMLPGWIGWEFNPAFSLPLGMEVLVGVAVHRFLTVNTLAAKIGTGAIALLATVLAGVVQVFAHTPGPLPGWLGPMVGVLPVLSLVLVAVLGTIRPTR